MLIAAPVPELRLRTRTDAASSTAGGMRRDERPAGIIGDIDATLADLLGGLMEAIRRELTYAAPL